MNGRYPTLWHFFALLADACAIAVLFLHEKYIVAGLLAGGSAIGIAWLYYTSRMHDQGGYLIADSTTVLTFHDPESRKAHLVKRQRLIAIERNIKVLVEPNIRTDGRVENFRTSPGRVLNQDRAGVGFRCMVDLDRELPLFRQFKRTFEFDLIDSFPDPERETWLLHVTLPTRRLTGVLVFHPSKLPRRVRVTNIGLGAPKDASHLLKDDTGTNQQWKFSVKRPAMGSTYLFEWEW